MYITQYFTLFSVVPVCDLESHRYDFGTVWFWVSYLTTLTPSDFSSVKSRLPRLPHRLVQKILSPVQASCLLLAPRPILSPLHCRSLPCRYPISACLSHKQKLKKCLLNKLSDVKFPGENSSKVHHCRRMKFKLIGEPFKTVCSSVPAYRSSSPLGILLPHPGATGNEYVGGSWTRRKHSAQCRDSIILEEKSLF